MFIVKQIVFKNRLFITKMNVKDIRHYSPQSEISNIQKETENEQKIPIDNLGKQTSTDSKTNYPTFPNNTNPETGEVDGPKGPEPTRYGDWERKGRVSDF